MEKIEFENQLLEAIKKDDLKSFVFLMPSDADLNLCYGRFPLLSLLYMYSSFKILSKFEKKLLQIHNFRVVDERIELYKEFRRRARKSLRLFSGEEIIYPILMLAVLDERIILDNKFNFLYKNVEILDKLKNIYNLNHKTLVAAGVDYLELPKKNLTKGSCWILGVISFVLAVVVAMSAIFVSLVLNTKGIGSAKNPLKITNSSEFVLALERGDGYYTLKNDITISGYKTAVDEFSGVMDGAGYTLNIEGEISSSMIQNLTGTVKNIKIKLNNNQIKITQNSAIISGKNSGLIDNCVILGNFNQNYCAESEVFSGLFAAENDGSISNCKTQVSGAMQNNKETNAFFGLIVGQNLEKGKITNCLADNGIIIADTVDIAGIVGYNKGEILNSENKARLSQTSDKLWNPNVAGIAVTNFALIENCVNIAELNADSTLAVAPEDAYYVVIGGITCDNYGSVLSCVNTGEIKAEGEVMHVIAGGVAARNLTTQGYRGIVQYSQASANIMAKADTAQVCVGGVVAFNNTNSVVVNSGFIGIINADSNSVENKAIFMDEADKAIAVVSGGIVAVNQNSIIQNSYADVSFQCGVDVENVLKIYSGAIGYLGVYKYSYLSDPTIIFSNREAYKFIGDNFYVAKAEIKQCSYGIYGTLNDSGYYQGGLAESISDESAELLMKKCDTFNDIPEEVRNHA